ncbi:MAG: PD40 domain-containing protein [Saprospiraceae bacterium]|nr:PD40 domain-containing protein [Saprospiraceae bacterium]
MRAKNFFLIPVVFLLTITVASAQYFGRNKPNYEKFDFKIHQSEHFDIYHYLDNPEYLKELAAQSEHWYQLHQAILHDTIAQKNPLIFYNNHADFQQTNTIRGNIGVGTGGVTEAFKNRVIMPLAMSNQQTHHVLGHELVHAFQFNMILNGDSTNLRNLSNLPLWLVEGMAEYMSIGAVDAHTAMWMRDAVLRDDIPTLDQLNNLGKYFPYRYGQVFWAFLTGLRGDEIIAPFFKATAMFGLDRASIMVLGMRKKDLSKLWVESFRRHFGKDLGDKKENLIGKALITSENGGRLNIAPEISPNGQYLIFLSEKDLFSTDLFLADAKTGKIIRKVASASREGHIDDFNYIESSGTWSPNSKEFAFVGVSKGDNILVIKEAATGKTVKEIRPKGLPAFSNPAWSPDKKSIVVTGLVNGQIDLYSIRVSSGKVTQLTDDRYAEIHPAWSVDGNFLFFSTDEQSMKNGRTNGKWAFNLAELDIVSGLKSPVNIFPGADNLNPEQDTEGNLIFLSNRDGFRNIYKYHPATGEVFQLTDLLTGVSGITPVAPAISLDRKRNRLVYTYFSGNRYQIYQTKVDRMEAEMVDPQEVDFTAAELPKLNKKIQRVVDSQLASLDQMETQPTPTLVQKDYRPKFKLDYVGGSAGAGIGNSPAFGTTTGLAGGVDLLFSDILGNNQLFSSLSLNGEITDIGGTIAYINRNSRINWGGAVSHTPFRSIQGGYLGVDTLFFGDDAFRLADRYRFDVTRIFEDKATLFAQYPFSTTLRLEAGASFSRYSFRVDRLDNYYDVFGNLIAQDRQKLDNAPPAFNLGNVQLALVADNANFGLTAPLSGHRYRFGVEQFFGEFNYTAATADYRIYRYYKPVGLAFRAFHYGRYGGNSEGLFPLYAGSPWYLRGLNSAAAQDIFVQNGRSFNDLLGNKLLVTNFEVRIPFSGPQQLALVKSKFLFSDLNFFVDGGVAFNSFNELFEDSRDIRFQRAKPIFTAGASVRVNLFGALVLEPYYAVPLVKETKGVFGLNIIPGW